MGEEQIYHFTDSSTSSIDEDEQRPARRPSLYDARPTFILGPPVTLGRPLVPVPLPPLSPGIGSLQPTPFIESGPSFIDPFGRPPFQDEHPSYNIDVGSIAPSLRIRYGSASVSVSSRQSQFQSNPDLLSHESSAFATHRKSHMSRSATQAHRRPRPSTMLKTEIPKPWLKYKDPGHRWAKLIFFGLWLGGAALVAGLCYEAYKSVPTLGKICTVMEDDFSSGKLSSLLWQHEVALDYGRLGTFDWTTSSSNNSFISDSTLYLVPTLTADHLGEGAITNGYTLNLTADGTCTTTNVTRCVSRSNITLGTVINPAQGVRLNSKLSMKYGKIEILARLPTGDWIWPSIRLLPVNNTYGAWPKSGEVAILNARGNGPGYSTLGSDYMQSSLHWGPHPNFDSFFRTWGIRRDRVNAYSSEYRKYTLEWNDKYIMTYIDNKVQTVMSVKFDRPFWGRGEYPLFYTNQGGDIARLENPWYNSPNNAAPFDQEFHLQLGVGVGGTGGYFPDNEGGKPWQDSSPIASADFWTARDRWLSTWPKDPTQRGMAIKSVKMYKTC